MYGWIVSGVCLGGLVAYFVVSAYAVRYVIRKGRDET